VTLLLLRLLVIVSTIIKFLNFIFVFILVLSNRFYIFISARFLVFSYSDFWRWWKRITTQIRCLSLPIGTMDKSCRCSLSLYLFFARCYWLCACVLLYFNLLFFSLVYYCINLHIVKTFPVYLFFSLSLTFVFFSASYLCFSFKQKTKRKINIFYLLSKT